MTSTRQQREGLQGLLPEERQALDGMEEIYPVQSTDARSVVRRRTDVVHDETGLQLADVRQWRSTPRNLISRASSSRLEITANTFQNHLVDQKGFNAVLEGPEMDTLAPDAELMEPPQGTMCPFLLRVTVSTFAVPLGLSSQSQLWGSLSRSPIIKSALAGAEIPDTIQLVFWIISLCLLVVIGLIYIAKACLYWGAIKREWAHPVRASFFLTPVLTALALISGEPRLIIDALHPDSDVPLWTLIFFGALMLYLEMSLYGKWLFDQGTSLKQANPSYQIGVVGNFLVASLGSNVSGSAAIVATCGEIALMFFSVGILYQLTVFIAIQQSSATNIEQAMGTIKRSGRVLKSSEAEGKNVTSANSNGTSSRGSQDPAGGVGVDTDGNVDSEVLGIPSTVAGPRSQSTRQRHVGVAFPVDRVITADEMDRRDIADRGGDLEAYGAPSLASVGGASSEATTAISSRVKTNGSVAEGEGRGRERGAKVHDQPMDNKSSQDLPPPATTNTASGATPPGGALIGKKLHPIYFLFVAPPSAAAIAWSSISGEFDNLSKSLFFISGFLYMFLALFNSSFLRAPFGLAWWAYTFPSATFASAALLYADELNVPAAGRGAFVVAIVSTFVVSMVFVRTVYTSLRGELFGRDPVVGVCLKDCH